MERAGNVKMFNFIRRDVPLLSPDICGPWRELWMHYELMNPENSLKERPGLKKKTKQRKYEGLGIRAKCSIC